MPCNSGYVGCQRLSDERRRGQFLLVALWCIAHKMKFGWNKWNGHGHARSIQHAVPVWISEYKWIERLGRFYRRCLHVRRFSGALKIFDPKINVHVYVWQVAARTRTRYNTQHTLSAWLHFRIHLLTRFRLLDHFVIFQSSAFAFFGGHLYYFISERRTLYIGIGICRVAERIGHFIYWSVSHRLSDSFGFFFIFFIFIFRICSKELSTTTELCVASRNCASINDSTQTVCVRVDVRSSFDTVIVTSPMKNTISLYDALN